MNIEVNKIDRKKIALFLLITFLLSSAIAGLFLLLNGKINTPAYTAMAVVYMFMPLVGTLLVQKWIYRGNILTPYQVRFKFNRWIIIGLLIPPLLAFATFGVSLLFPTVEYAPEMSGLFERFKDTLTPEQLQTMKEQVKNLPVHPIWLALLQGLIAGITINAVAAFGEELGWRGFLQKELTPLGFWRYTSLTGFIWGVWHAPLILQGHNYPQHPVAGVFMMIIWCILLSPLIGYVRLKANTVLAAAVFHGSLNANYGLAIMLIKGGNDLLVGLTGLAGFIVLAGANLVLYFVRRNEER